MSALVDRLDETTAAALAGLRKRLLTESPPAPPEVCRECGQRRPAAGGLAASDSPAGVPAVLFRAPGVDGGPGSERHQRPQSRR